MITESGWVERAANRILSLDDEETYMTHYSGAANQVRTRKCCEIIREEYAKDVAASGSVAGLVAKWRQIALDSQEEQYNDGDYGECAKQLEAALAKDELRVAAVELANTVLTATSMRGKVEGIGREDMRSGAERVLRLAGEA